MQPQAGLAQPKTQQSPLEQELPLLATHHQQRPGGNRQPASKHNAALCLGFKPEIQGNWHAPRSSTRHQ
jgi:hypothetical protein